MEVKCQNPKCEETYEPIPHNKKYCSNKCYKSAEYQRNKKTYQAYETKNRERISARQLKRYNKLKDEINAQVRERYAQKKNKDQENHDE